jgi:hypothetical protein
MVLTIFVVWLVLAAAAAFFVYCCSRVSDGATRDRVDNDLAVEDPAHPLVV